jgi:hypothetical protein
MNIIKQFALAIWSLIVAIGSIFIYEKFVDKPETVVNNKIGKIKNKGDNNDVSTESHTDVSNDNKEVKNKRKFKLFRRKK